MTRQVLSGSSTAEIVLLRFAGDVQRGRVVDDLPVRGGPYPHRDGATG